MVALQLFTVVFSFVPMGLMVLSLAHVDTKLEPDQDSHRKRDRITASITLWENNPDSGIYYT